MKRAILYVLLTMLFMAGCAENEANDDPAPINPASDNRISDPSILENDPELHRGDFGVENVIPNYVPQDGVAPLETKGTDSPGYRIYARSLRRVSPNYNIKPINGNYANNVISFGSMFMGTPYQFGSNRNEPSTFDCSDFTRYAFLGALGMDIPKDSRAQARYVQAYGNRKYWNLRYAKRGDLLFFMNYKGYRSQNYKGINKAKQRITHCGIYLGDGYILHTASNKTGGVRIDYIYNKHLEWRFISGGGVLP